MFIFARVTPSVVPKDVAVKSIFDCVVKVFVSSSGLEFALLSLNDCVAITLTSNLTAFPPLNPPIPNNSESADELTIVEPPELESKSIKCVLPLS